MPEYRRTNLSGGSYFFTVNTLERQPLLIKDPFRLALHQGVVLARRAYPFTIDAWVLLPDHLHCIWTLPPGDSAFSKRWAIIKRHVTQQCNLGAGSVVSRSSSRQKRHEGGLWQRRFWEHVIRDEADLRMHIDYIHWNPVKHGHVKQVKEWAFSTFHRYVALGIYPLDWGGVDEHASPTTGFGE